MYKKGESVSVKAETLDYGQKKFDLGGWEGRVIDIEFSKAGIFVEVQWDSITLAAMPFEFIEASVEDDVEYENYILLEKDLLRSSPRDTEADVHRAQAEINHKFFEPEGE
jgi:hypothetical protein